MAQECIRHILACQCSLYSSYYFSSIVNSRIVYSATSIFSLRNLTYSSACSLLSYVAASFILVTNEKYEYADFLPTHQSFPHFIIYIYFSFELIEELWHMKNILSNILKKNFFFCLCLLGHSNDIHLNCSRGI